MRRLSIPASVSALALVGLAACGSSCDKKGGQYGKNLLVNGSFEQVGRDGVPSGWSVENFRGPVDAFASRWGVDNQVAQDGKRYRSLGEIGIRVMGTPSASSTAEANSAMPGITPASPAPLMPSGFSGEGVCRWSISTVGTSVA